jgi:NTP pyrophosphatase (non-canonical NTP hydrolase)
LSEEESLGLSESALKEVAEEIADIQIYLVRLADKLEIDILEAAEAKLEENDRKYPASRVKGSSKKYSEYPEGNPGP